MQAVASDQGEEGGQKRAARRAVAARNEIGELVEFDAQERKPEQVTAIAM